MIRKLFKIPLLPALIWGLLILVSIGFPGSNLPDVSVYSADKFAHAFIFFVFSFLLAKGLLMQNKLLTLKKEPVYFTLLISLFYGVLTEVLQDKIFIERTADVMDMIANATGAVLGLIAFKLSYRFF
jgi:VanZ family protein